MNKNLSELIKGMNAALSIKRNSQDESKKEEARKEIDNISECMLQNISDLGEVIKNHYNSIVYNVDNGTAGIKQYDKRSVIREIMQNIIDCDYSDDLMIKILFNDVNNEIMFCYNEDGFKLSDTISFFSLEHTSKNTGHTGAFGIGAKGALLNARYLKVESRTKNAQDAYLTTIFKIVTKTQSGKLTLEIEELLFSQSIENELEGTQLIISLDDDLYREIKWNLNNLVGEKKGKFITPLDIVFASTKKEDKNITIAINNNNIAVKYFSTEKKVMFTYNETGALFNLYKSNTSKYVYAFFYSRINCDEEPCYIGKYKYNYFSTYELIGSDSDIQENGIQFWVNLPTLDCEGSAIITDDRTGIEPKQQSTVMNHIKQDCMDMLKIYGEKQELFFSLEKGYSYILSQFYSVIEAKFSSLKRSLFDATYLKVDNDTYIKINELYFVHYTNENRELLKSISNKYFVLVDEYYGKKSEYSKYQIMRYYYHIYKGSNYLGTLSQNVEWESGENAPQKEMIIDILKERVLTSDASVYLMSALDDKQFSEQTLIKLLKACIKRNDIGFVFYAGNKRIKVADLEFQLEFPINQLETIRRSIELSLKRKEVNEFYKYVCDSYKKQFYNIERQNNLDILKAYSKVYGIQFSFDDENNILVQIEAEGSRYTLDTIDVKTIGYMELIEVIKITNYRLLIGKELDEKFRIIDSIETYFGLDINEIRYYSNKEELSLTNIYIGDSDYDLGDKDVVIKTKGNRISSIIEIHQKEEQVYEGSAIYIILPAKNKTGKRDKISITKVASFLDVLFDTECIKNLYRKAEKPITRLNAQIAYTMKPLVNITKREIIMIENYLKYHAHKPEKKARVFAMDINSKLFGYSSICPICGYESDSINAFLVREKVKYYENSKEFQISLFLCANEWYESESWVIQKIAFMDDSREYSISFENWIKSINDKGMIERNSLKCKINIVQKYINSLFEFDKQEEDNRSCEKKIILSPALAVDWYTKNRHKI